ncbi:MAG: exopolyphosphatase [Desulfobacterales bacterium]
MRIVTRPDFDGLVCAALLMESEAVDEPILWVEPSQMQKGEVAVRSSDIVANLPHHPNCLLWFDHHYSNRTDRPFQGLFELAPSAAGLVYRHYRDVLSGRYDELVRQADKIDAAELTEDEVLHPERYPYILLSMTLSGGDREDEAYWNRLVDLLRRQPIDRILSDPEVQARCRQVEADNRRYKDLLAKNTILHGHVAVTDFRPLGCSPRGNRFLVYSMFPQSVVQVKIRYDDEDRHRVAVSIGHSIFNRNCKVNVGLLLTRFEGGGHPGAGSCRFDADKADRYIPAILEILKANRPIEPDVPPGKPDAS